MNPLHPSEPTRATINSRREVAQALRDLAARVEQGEGYYAEVTLDAYTQRSGLPMRKASTRDGYSEFRMANTKYIGFTLLLRESSHAWLASMLQAQWMLPQSPPPTTRDEPPFELKP